LINYQTGSGLRGVLQKDFIVDTLAVVGASLVWPKLVWPNARLDETHLAETHLAKKTHLAEKWQKILQKWIE
jgi:hypothetical protein